MLYVCECTHSTSSSVMQRLSRFLEGFMPSCLWYRWNYEVETSVLLSIARLPKQCYMYHAIKLVYYYFCTSPLIWIPNAVYYRQMYKNWQILWSPHYWATLKSPPALISAPTWPLCAAIIYWCGHVLHIRSISTYNNVANITTLLFALRYQNLYALSMMSWILKCKLRNLYHLSSKITTKLQTCTKQQIPTPKHVLNTAANTVFPRIVPARRIVSALE